MAIKTIIIKEGQTIFDLSIQLYGDIKYIYKIISDNPTITHLQYAGLRGLEINYEEQKTDITENFKVNKITIATKGVTSGVVAAAGQAGTSGGDGLLTDDGIMLIVD